MKPETLTVVRRAHLFLGLFMAPWVLIYGATGFYFHHRPWFTAEATPRPAPIEFSTKDSRNPTLGQWPEPEELIQKVIAGMNQQSGSVAYMMASGSARLETVISLPLKWEKDTGSATLDRVTKDGSVVRNPQWTPPKTITLEHVISPVFETDSVTRLRAELAPIIQGLDPKIRDVGAPRLPELRFKVEQGGQTWNAACDLTTGTVKLTAAQAMAPINLLERLHKTYGYSASNSWVRTVWGVVTDMVALTLCFWVLTGLIMWYQLKAVRRIGYVVLGIVTVTAVLVLSGMWKEFAG